LHFLFAYVIPGWGSKTPMVSIKPGPGR
jgi:hypothetical protein